MNLRKHNYPTCAKIPGIKYDIEKIRKEVKQEEKANLMNLQNQQCEEKEIESNSSDLSEEPKAAG